ncbi:hypothetical protein FB639_006257, partial [Coemansia asiatica]
SSSQPVESSSVKDTSNRLENNKKAEKVKNTPSESVQSSESSTSSESLSLSSAATITTPSTSKVITLEQLNQANPDAAKDSYCSSGNDQCSTNADAVGPLNDAIAKYQMTRRGEIVGVIANMLFESGAWSENINSGNSEGGQGTRCMMMWNYVSEYAKSLHPEDYATLMGSDTGNPDGASVSVRTKVMDLVLNPEDSFGSGFWYLVEKASSFHGDENKLRDGNLDDFKDYVQNGI